MGAIGWVAGIAAVVIGGVVTAYFLHVFDPWINPRPEVKWITFEPFQASNPFGTGTVGAPQKQCGGPTQLGCDYGSITLKLANNGNTKAEHCSLSIREEFDIASARGSDVILAGTPMHQTRQIGGDSSFEIARGGTYETRIAVEYPYIGNYKFAGSIICDGRVSVDLPERNLAITK